MNKQTFVIALFLLSGIASATTTLNELGLSSGAAWNVTIIGTTNQSMPFNGYFSSSTGSISLSTAQLPGGVYTVNALSKYAQRAAGAQEQRAPDFPRRPCHRSHRRRRSRTLCSSRLRHERQPKHSHGGQGEGDSRPDSRETRTAALPPSSLRPRAQRRRYALQRAPRHRARGGGAPARSGEAQGLQVQGEALAGRQSSSSSRYRPTVRGSGSGSGGRRARRTESRRS